MTDDSMPGRLGRIAGFLTGTLVQAKSYVIFSFLFGYSLSILLDKVAARGQSANRVYAQRLGVLALFGIVHACHFFVGDIRVLYAVLGASLPLRLRSFRTLLRLAALPLIVQVAVFAALALLPTGDVAGRRLMEARRGARRDMDARPCLARRAFFVTVIQGPLVAALFCVGLVCGRSRLLADPEAIRPALLRIHRWGFAIGLPIQTAAGILGVWPGIDHAPGRQLLAIALMCPTAPILSTAYVATIAQLPRCGLARCVEADGRMSLSVCLGESLFATTLAAGWSFGRFVLLTSASWWSRRFGVGPAERLPRRLTYAGLPRPGAARSLSGSD